MEEITKIHSLEPEWYHICALVEKISTEEEILGGWPELINMIGEVFGKMGGEKDPRTLFFNVYEFFFRLLYRVKAFDKPESFNRVTERDDMFLVNNYDHKMFLWAIEHGLRDTITNGWIEVPKSKLTPAETRNFSRRAKK